MGGSEESIDEIKDGDTESVTFKLKASQDAKPGDYTIPYTLVYTIDDGNDTIIKEQGTIGVTIGAKTELDYSVESNNPVVGNKGKITVKVINRGFGDIKFASPIGGISLNEPSELVRSLIKKITFDKLDVKDAVKVGGFGGRDFNRDLWLYGIYAGLAVSIPLGN